MFQINGFSLKLHTSYIKHFQRLYDHKRIISKRFYQQLRELRFSQSVLHCMNEIKRSINHQQYTRKDPNRNDADFNPFILACLRNVFGCRILR